MKVFIFGSSGMLGDYMRSYLSTSLDVICISRKDYDLSAPTMAGLTCVLEERGLQENDVVINCSGIVPQALDKKTDNLRLYFGVNAIFPTLLAELCNRIGSKSIHITTDCVFSGQDGCYDEQSPHDGTSDYSVSKSLGELCGSTIIRTSIIGEQKQGKYSLLEWARSNAGGDIDGYTNHMWNGVTCLQLAKVVRNIISDGKYWEGVRHVFSPKKVSKFELISMIDKEYNLNMNIRALEAPVSVDRTLTTKYYMSWKTPDLLEQISDLKSYKQPEIPVTSHPERTKTVVTVTGIRPDFIRMSEIFKKLDKRFNHILVHTGQHYDNNLSGIFFEQLDIRDPDYILSTGGHNLEHYHQLSNLSISIIDLFKREDIRPDIILFLGDSNSVCASLPLRKEGYVVGHIEAGMRSFDKSMLEEINRTVCDHCSHIHFVYHASYKTFLANESIIDNVHIVGNTITEVCRQFIPDEPKGKKWILVDVHRPETFKHEARISNILEYARKCGEKYNVPVKMLKFGRTFDYIKKFGLSTQGIDIVELMSYKDYLSTAYHSLFLISDSGTGQEEPALLGTPVIVPRDYTERPQSVENNCSYMLNINTNREFEDSWNWLGKVSSGELKMRVEWLGEGNTSDLVVEKLSEFLS